MELQNRTAIVTGASSGIGAAIALRLGREGVNVALFARSKDKLEKLQYKINETGGNAISVPTDVTDEKNVKKSLDRTLKQFKSLDILINNAGLGIFNRVEDMAFSDWERQIKVMLNGLFLMTKYALPHMYKQKKGHIIAISSLWAIKGCVTCTAYTAAKFGMRGFMESLREEARENQVKVTNIMPGTVNTPFFEKAEYNAERDMSNVLQPGDIAETVVYALKLSEKAVAEEIIIQSLNPPY